MILSVLAFFLVFASVLDGGGPLEGLYLLAFVAVSTLGLLHVGRQGTLLATGPTTRIAGKLLLPAAPIMIVLFLLFPRLPGPIWSLPGSTSSAASGLSDSMSPGDITDLGLSDEVAFRVEFTGQPLPASLPLEFRRHLLLAFKEALHNVARHARASTVRARVDWDGRRLRLTVTDDGCGFEPGQVVEGTGLGSLRARAAALGGSCAITSGPGRGTTFMLEAIVS